MFGTAWLLRGLGVSRHSFKLFISKVLACCFVRMPHAPLSIRREVITGGGANAPHRRRV